VCHSTAHPACNEVQPNRDIQAGLGVMQKAFDGQRMWPTSVRGPCVFTDCPATAKGTEVLGLGRRLIGELEKAAGPSLGLCTSCHRLHEGDNGGHFGPPFGILLQAHDGPPPQCVRA